jgi:hypothetical protein
MDDARAGMVNTRRRGSSPGRSTAEIELREASYVTGVAEALPWVAADISTALQAAAERAGRGLIRAVGKSASAIKPVIACSTLLGSVSNAST